MTLTSKQVDFKDLLILSLLQERDRLLKENTTDTLTGIGNRRKFDTVYNTEFQAAVEQFEPISLIVFDVDNFKQVNTLLGHEGGDRALCEIVVIASSVIRKTDTICRHGGEEFVIVLPDANLSQCLEVAERVRREIFEQSDYTVSLGIAVSVTPRLDCKSSLLRLAYENMSTAKKLGKNKVHSS